MVQHHFEFHFVTILFSNLHENYSVEILIIYGIKLVTRGIINYKKTEALTGLVQILCVISDPLST